MSQVKIPKKLRDSVREIWQFSDGKVRVTLQGSHHYFGKRVIDADSQRAAFRKIGRIWAYGRWVPRSLSGCPPDIEHLQSERLTCR